MAKRGLIFKSEEEFKKEYQPERMGQGAFKQVVEQLRANNLTSKTISAESVKVKTLDADPVIKDSKEAKFKQEELKNNEVLLESNKKLNTNIEKLTRVISEGSISSQRAESMARSQQFDYRGIGQQIKEKFTGRAGNKYDPSGMAWKLGSVRGLMHTTGLVQAGSGGFLDEKLAVREERLRTAREMALANPNSTVNYAESSKRLQQAKANLQTEQYKIDTAQELIPEEQYTKTAGGKKTIEARNAAAQAIIENETRSEENIQDKLNVSQEESDTLKALNASVEPINELILITKAENEREAKADADMLVALNNIAAVSGSGGSLGNLASSALNTLGGVPKSGGYLSKVGGAGKLMKGLGIGAVGALAGEGLQMGGEKLQEAGYEKTGKAVGTGGTAVKYAGYGAMIGSVIPGVGTAIGAGIGGAVGLGKGIYDNYYKDKPKVTKAEGSQASEMRMDFTDPNNPKYLLNGKEISASEYERLSNIEDPIDQAKAIAAASNKADQVSARSADNAVAKLPSNTAPATNIVNAPTTISKSSTNNAIKVPVRDQDHSVRKYYNSRFAT